MCHMYVHKCDAMQAMGEHYQATCFALMVLPTTSTTVGHTMLLLTVLGMLAK